VSSGALLLLLAGLLALAAGAEVVVRSATRLAASAGVSPMTLGLTVVAIGTSMPELAVGITAANQGTPGLAIGNIAGTNLVNLLFILGLSALLDPLSLHLRVIRLDLPAMVVAALMMTMMSWDGRLARAEGLLLVGTAVIYTIALVQVSRRESHVVRAEYRVMYPGDAETARPTLYTQAKQTLMLVAGMALTVLGAEWLVDGAVAVARAVGISDAVIGLTIVAIGTSAPELATTIVSTIKRERDVAVGNLLGSSIYNILVILGLTCLAVPGGLHVDRVLLLFDIPLMVAVALLCVPVFVTGHRVSRIEGGIFVSVYIAYVVFILIRS